MTAVSCRVTDWMLDWLADERLSAERWVRNLPIDVERLRDSEQRIDWDVFVTLCRRLEEMFDDRQALLASARAHLESRMRREAPRLNGGFDHPQQLFWIAQHWFGPAMFPGLIRPFDAWTPEQLTVSVETPETDPPCALLFPLIECALATVPVLIGEPTAVVRSEIDVRRATYTIDISNLTDEKRTDAAQQLQDLHYRSIAEHSENLIVEFDANGRLDFMTPSSSAVLGHAKESAFGVTDPDGLHPKERQSVIERLTKTFHTGAIEHLTFRARHRDGSWRWLESTATAYPTQSGNVRGVLIARDITSRLRVEQECQRLASVVESSSEFIAIFSIDGGIQFMNEGGQRLIGLAPPRNPLDKTIFDCVFDHDAQDTRFRVLPDVLRNGHWVGDYWLRNVETGQRIATLANIFTVSEFETGSQPVLAIVARDISEREVAERALRESEQRYRTLVENAYDLVAEIDAQQRFVYVSHNYRDLLGYAPEDLLGRPIEDLLHPDEFDGDAEGGPLQEPGLSVSHRMRHLDGSWRWLQSHTRAIQSKAGEARSVITSRDITARRSAEDALRDSHEQLLQSQKMEAIGRLAGGVAHDFNNLLTAITGNCDLLLADIDSDHPARAEAHEIMRAAERAGDLTRQLLAFSRRQALQPEVLDLNAVVSEIDRMLRRLIGEDIELITSLEGELAHIKVDAGQLEQLIMNLVVNARDAMPRGGRLVIETAQVEIRDSTNPDHWGIEPGCYVTLAVRDCGVGMDEETVSRIFEPFFTTKESGKGTGLGLSTAYGIVQQSGGHIRVDSEPARGSTFCVYLPCVNELPSVSETGTVHKELRGRECILLVEDAEPVRLLIRRFLTKHGYTVLDAASGIEALRISRRHDGDIDLLVTDVVLPKMDGRELTGRITQRRPDIEVIFMSGSSDDALSDHDVIGTETALVQKPFRPATLLSKIREVLADDTAG